MMSLNAARAPFHPGSTGGLSEMTLDDFDDAPAHVDNPFTFVDITAIDDLTVSAVYWGMKYVQWKNFIKIKFGYSDEQAELEIRRIVCWFYDATANGTIPDTDDGLAEVTTLRYYLDEINVQTFNRGSARWLRSNIFHVYDCEDQQVAIPESWWTRQKKAFLDKIGKFYDEHPILTKVFSALAICGVVMSAYGLYNCIFASPKPKELEEDFAETPEVICSVTKSQHLYEPAGSGCGHLDTTGRPLEPQGSAYHVQGRRSAAPRTTRTIVRPQKGELPRVQPQDYDQNLNALINFKIRRNLFVAVHHASPERQRHVNALGIKGKLILINYHFMRGIKDGDLFSLFSQNQTEFVEEFDFRRLKRLRDTDICMYECSASFPACKDISDKFITMEDIQYFDSIEATYCGLNSNFNMDQFTGRVKSLDYLNEIHHFDLYDERTQNNERTYVRKGWVMKANTANGYCGSPLFGFNIPGAGKIIGIHTASWGKTKPDALASAVVFEDIVDLLSYFQPQVVDTWRDSEQYQRILVDKKADPQMDGNFTSEGSFNMRSRQATNTRIRPTPLQGFFPHAPVTEPAVLHSKDVRLNENLIGCNLLKKQIEKYGQVQLPLPRMDLEIAADDIGQRFNAFQTDMKPRVLTLHEAINGVPGLPYYDALDMSTSPGYPYVNMRPKGQRGKAFLFEGEPGNYKIKNPVLMKAVMDRIKKIESGELPFSVWDNHLKDERRKKQKIQEGATRSFCAAPVDFTIVSRMYFLSWCAAFNANKNNFFGTIGINPDGPDWTQLYNRHKVKGNYSFDDDSKNFDGSAKAMAMWATVDKINEWYNDGPQNALARHTLIEEMIHTRSKMDNFIIQKHGGVPSGTNLTATLNSVIHAIYIRIIYRIAMRRGGRRDLLSMRVFNQRVADSTFGDDGFITSDLEILKYFNRVTFIAIAKDFGLTITGAAKNGIVSKYESLDSIQFLKRHFAQHPTFPDMMLAPIDVDTIYELINWMTNCPDVEEQLRMNIEDALSFAYHYGDKFFDTFRNEVSRSLKRADINSIHLSTWQEYDEHYIDEWLGERDSEHRL